MTLPVRLSRLAAAVSLLTLGLLTADVGTAAASPAPSSASTTGTVVLLRVEGATSTLFEAPVLTVPHAVTTPSGGTHHCDGTNNGANPTAGPTATGALDNGAQAGGFSWDGTYFASFDDYLVTSIAGESQTDTQFWALLRNGSLTPVGGCQQQVRLGDEVLFAFDGFAKAHALKLSGPVLARAGQQARYTVTDAATGAPIAGATVAGASTDAQGQALVTFHNTGVTRVKADRADSIRSNSVWTLVTN
ncbi:DUF4430 domain-containing protein [Actinophytocola sp.]|uniref:DUF4430 domain-containing protein n=1 Tax=Actinophytocola sp. TaxID=1872138 RepID=UPI00389AF99C